MKTMYTELIEEFKGKYRFLSNFWPCSIDYKGILYPTVEHAYQAQKTIDNVQRVVISQCKTPALAKHMGRYVSIRLDWEEVKEATMLVLLKKKFQDPILEEKLLATGDALLVEGNWWHDIYWGFDLQTNTGLNRLGELLMQVRRELVEKGVKNENE